MSSILSRYQEQVEEGLFIKEGYDKIVHCTLGLVGEAGEVAELVKKSQYAGRSYPSAAVVQDELGDVLWYLTNLATLHHCTLEDLAELNIIKLEKRHRESKYSYQKLIRS